MTTLQTAIKQATKNLLNNPKARTFTADGKTYTLKLERDQSGDPECENLYHITTWGFDYEDFRIPTTRAEVNRQKILAQLALPDYSAQVMTRYCLDILRRESN